MLRVQIKVLGNCPFVDVIASNTFILENSVQATV